MSKLEQFPSMLAVQIIHNAQSGLTFEYKGNFYNVLSAVRVKSPDSGNWFEAISYHRVNDSSVFIRETLDFSVKFKISTKLRLL